MYITLPPVNPNPIVLLWFSYSLRTLCFPRATLTFLIPIVFLRSSYSFHTLCFPRGTLTFLIPIVFLRLSYSFHTLCFPRETPTFLIPVVNADPVKKGSGWRVLTRPEEMNQISSPAYVSTLSPKP